MADEEIRKYTSSPKHEPGGWGTTMDLDEAIASEVLNKGVVAPNNRQIYGYYNGQVYEFQPDNIGSYHGYPIPGNQAPPSILRGWLKDAIITSVEYKRLIKGQ